MTSFFAIFSTMKFFLIFHHRIHLFTNSQHIIGQNGWAKWVVNDLIRSVISLSDVNRANWLIRPRHSPSWGPPGTRIDRPVPRTLALWLIAKKWPIKYDWKLNSPNKLILIFGSNIRPLHLLLQFILCWFYFDHSMPQKSKMELQILAHSLAARIDKNVKMISFVVSHWIKVARFGLGPRNTHDNKIRINSCDRD